MISNQKKLSRGDVLIINERPTTCKTLQTYCENMGCFRNIILAHDGQAASSKLHNQKFGLILLDIQIPKKNGLEVMKELNDKTLNSRNHIVVVSASLNKDSLEKSLSFGVKTFLAEPFTEGDFQERVLKILSHKPEPVK